MTSLKIRASKALWEPGKDLKVVPIHNADQAKRAVEAVFFEIGQHMDELALLTSTDRTWESIYKELRHEFG